MGSRTFPAALLALVALACSDGQSSTAGSGNSTGSGGNGTGNANAGGSTSASGGASTGGGVSTSGGSGGVNGNTGGTANSTGSGGTGNTGTGAAPGGGTGGTIQPPPPTDGGLSVYTVDCNGSQGPDSALCGYPAATCLGVTVSSTVAGFTCSNVCNTVADCSDAPSGTDAAPGCLQFTSAKRCVLVCSEGTTTHACPGGMTCYVYPNTTVGYCLYM